MVLAFVNILSSGLFLLNLLLVSNTLWQHYVKHFVLLFFLAVLCLCCGAWVVLCCGVRASLAAGTWASLVVASGLQSVRAQ